MWPIVFLSLLLVPMSLAAKSVWKTVGDAYGLEFLVDLGTAKYIDHSATIESKFIMRGITGKVTHEVFSLIEVNCETGLSRHLDRYEKTPTGDKRKAPSVENTEWRQPKPGTPGWLEADYACRFGVLNTQKKPLRLNH
ncbi:MAG: hypothetical protein ACOYLM_13330 [Methylococcaceae bacterium]